MGTQRRQRSHKTHPTHTPENPRILTARFPGVCKTTGRRYNVGDRIISRGNGWELYDSNTPQTETQTTDNTTQGTYHAPANAGHEVFNSLAEYLHYVETTPLHPNAIRYGEKTRREVSDFFHLKNFDEAMTAARTGWSDGAERIAEALAALPPVCPPDTEQNWQHDVTGDEWDMGRVIADEPEAALSYTPNDGDGKIIKISVAAAQSCIVKPSVTEARGAVIAAAVQQLQTQGYSVELSVWYAVTNRKTDAIETTEVTLMTAGQPIEIDRLAFFILCADAYRRLQFRVQETRPKPCPRYGRFSQEADAARPQGQCHVFIPRIDHYHTPEQAAAAVMEQFHAAGLLN